MKPKDAKVLLAFMLMLVIGLLYMAYEVQSGDYIISKHKRDVAIMESYPVVPRAQEVEIVWLRNK